LTWASVDSIVNDKLDIVGGGLTGDLFASASLPTEAKKPTVIMLSSTSAVIDKSPYFVRTSCTLVQSSAIMADWAMKSGIKWLVTVVSDFSHLQGPEAPVHSTLHSKSALPLTEQTRRGAINGARA
jgi:ABC-type branched-subunit amino acid transport system substrate-binding protein